MSFFYDELNALFLISAVVAGISATNPAAAGELSSCGVNAPQHIECVISDR